MNEAVADTLRDLIAANGPGLADQPRRVEGFLRDLHPDDPMEASVLVEALDRGVVARLKALPSLPRGAQREVLVAALTEESGLALRPAEWAVGVWCRTLLGEVAAGSGRRARRWASRVSDRPGTLKDVLVRTEEAQQ